MDGHDVPSDATVLRLDHGSTDAIVAASDVASLRIDKRDTYIERNPCRSAKNDELQSESAHSCSVELHQIPLTHHDGLTIRRDRPLRSGYREAHTNPGSCRDRSTASFAQALARTLGNQLHLFRAETSASEGAESRQLIIGKSQHAQWWHVRQLCGTESGTRRRGHSSQL
jgi:hypothetical protein